MAPLDPTDPRRLTTPHQEEEEQRHQRATAKKARAASFGKAAALYAQVRPSYPGEAVAWLVPQQARVVVDLGAGTGKFTRSLIRPGRDVIAVEPSDAMRAQLQADVPAARALAGRSDAIDLPDSSVDAVVVAQAWHWFDPESTCREVARVLRPGGTLGVVWNVRRDSVPWMAEFSRILHTGDTLQDLYAKPEVTAEFAEPEGAHFPWEDEADAHSLRDLAATRSNILTLPPEEQDVVLAQIDVLVAEHQDLAGRSRFAVPYTAQCWRTVRRA